MSNVLRSLALLALIATTGCMQITEPVMDSTQQYFQRADTVTLSAGNAKDANTRIHEIDPWPRYVGNDVVNANGERMAGAAERYRDVSKQSRGPQPLPLVSADSPPSSSQAQSQ